jgi:hypothetical protein
MDIVGYLSAPHLTEPVGAYILQKSDSRLRLADTIHSLTESSQCRFLGAHHSGVQDCAIYNERYYCH